MSQPSSATRRPLSEQFPSTSNPSSAQPTPNKGTTGGLYRGMGTLGGGTANYHHTTTTSRTVLTSGASAAINTPRVMTGTSTYRSSSKTGGATLDYNNTVQSLQTLHNLILNQATEIEIERDQREARIRELTNKHNVELSEQREIIKQLRIENSTMKESLWSLERKVKTTATSSNNGAVQAYHGTAPDGGISAGYFGGSNTPGIPLLPRVGELETDVERIKAYLEKLKISERNRDEFQSKYATDCVILKDSVIAQCQELIDKEMDRYGMEQKHAHDVQVRDFFAFKDNLEADLNRRTEDLKRDVDMAEKKANEAIQIAKEAGLNTSPSGPNPNAIRQELDALRDETRSAQNADRRANDEALSNLRADLTKSIRDVGNEISENQHEIQGLINQKIDVATAQLVPREEYNRFQQQTINSLSQDVDSANKTAQTAKVIVEDLKREYNHRLTKVEADVESLKTTVDGMSENKNAVESQQRKLSSDVDELRGRFKTLQGLTEDAQQQGAQQAAKQQELNHSLEALTATVNRLKASVDSNINTDAQEKQAIKERLHVLEEGLQEATRKTRSMEDGLRADMDRAHKMANEAREESRSVMSRGIPQPQQVVTTEAVDYSGDFEATAKKIEGLQKKVNELQNRCAELETAVESQQENTAQLVQQRVDGGHKKLSAKIDDGLKECHAAIDEKAQGTNAALKQLEEQQNAKDRNNASALAGVKDQLQKRVAEVQEEASSGIQDLAQKQDRQKKDQERELGNVKNDIAQLTNGQQDVSQKVAQQGADISALGKAAEQQKQVEATEREALRDEINQKALASQDSKQKSRESATLKEGIEQLEDRVKVLEDVSEKKGRGRLGDAALEELCSRVAATVASEKVSENNALVAAKKAEEDKKASAKDAELEGRFENINVTINQIQTTSKETTNKIIAISADTNELHELIRDLTESLKASSAQTMELNTVVEGHDEILIKLNESVNGLHGDLSEAFTSGRDYYNSLRTATSRSSSTTTGIVNNVAPPNSFAEVIHLLLAQQTDLFAQFEGEKEQRTATSDSILKLAEVVDRHEVGFASLTEVMEAIEFNASNVVTLAETMGLDKEAYRLRVFNDSELQGVISMAGNQSSVGGTSASRNQSLMQHM